MNIRIVLPYENSDTLYACWAGGEDAVDFRKDPQSAARCTAAFAAVELKEHLERTLCEAVISISSERAQECLAIELEIDDIEGDGASFTLEPAGGGLVIRGESRKGLLYGAYEFLRLNGWRWHEPGMGGAIAPPRTRRLRLPEEKKACAPSMPLGRGFDFEYLSMESREMFLWMARNRMDVAAYRPLTGQFCRKLGMAFKNGGHIFEEILNPCRVMPSGRTLWEEHPDWFGLPEDGVRTVERAQKTQFCVSNEALVAFLGGEVLSLLRGKWREADRLDVWGFDTWGSGCCCEGCVKLGNGADRMLHFLSRLRGMLDEALRCGRLDHRVRLVMCAYEGTSTLEAPLRPIPENLVNAGDFCVLYPILRCYAHDLDDGACPRNRPYADALRGWLSHLPGLPVVVGEYYNVSKFEDLPLLFTGRIGSDIPCYRSTGVTGMTYMHVPMVNWGMRALTQLLYAQMIWDADTDAGAFAREYFTQRYGPYADMAGEAYGLVEEAWALCASWRAWGEGSVLTQLQKWDGFEPGAPLPVDGHFNTPEGAVASGRKSIRLMRRAMDILNAAIREARASLRAEPPAGAEAAVNPAGQRRGEACARYERRLSEDRRLLRYGLDTMAIMTRLAQYHNDLRRGRGEAARRVWRSIEALADRMDLYCVPIGYEWPGPGLESLDALTRSQTRELISRIRGARPGELRDGKEGGRI